MLGLSVVEFSILLDVAGTHTRQVFQVLLSWAIFLQSQLAIFSTCASSPCRSAVIFSRQCHLTIHGAYRLLAMRAACPTWLILLSQKVMTMSLTPLIWRRGWLPMWSRRNTPSILRSVAVSVTANTLGHLVWKVLFFWVRSLKFDISVISLSNFLFFCFFSKLYRCISTLFKRQFWFAIILWTLPFRAIFVNHGHVKNSSYFLIRVP